MEANGESFIPFMVLGLLKFQKDAARSEKLKREAAERISGTRGIDLGDVQNRKSRALLIFKAKRFLSLSALGPEIQE